MGEKLKERWQRKIHCKTRESLSTPAFVHYDEYRFSAGEFLRYTAEGIGIAALISYVFYRSIAAFFPLLGILYFYLKEKKKDCVLRQKQKLRQEFKETMGSLIAGLQAGYSVENAFMRSYADMVMLFGSKSLMAKELLQIKKKLHNNQNLEDILTDFAKRSGLKDIEDFAEVFRIAKRSGGDLPGMMRSTADLIFDKMEVERKIETLVSAKKYEQSIMNMVPFGIILYIDFSSPGFFDSLYHNVTGIIIMTVLLGVYIAAFFLAKKIISIPV